jgi:hypothetical protein
MADFLLALADLDRRKLWRDLGHASLFSFLRRELGLSAGAAQYRKTAAELVQGFPQVEAALRDGRLCLSSVIELAKVITPENATEVVPRFFGLSSRDAAQVAVSIRPVEDLPLREVVTPLRAAPPELAAAVESVSVPPAATPVADETEAFRARSRGHPRRPSAAARAPRPSDERAQVHHRAPHLAAVASPRHGLAPLPREARGGQRRPVARSSLRSGGGDPRGGPGPRPRRPCPAKGARGEAAEGAAPLESRVGSHPGPRAAGGLDARRRPLPVPDGGRDPLRFHLPARARSHRAAGARRAIDDREPPAGVQTPQRARGPAGVRGRLDGSVPGRKQTRGRPEGRSAPGEARTTW